MCCARICMHATCTHACMLLCCCAAHAVLLCCACCAVACAHTAGLGLRAAVLLAAACCAASCSCADMHKYVLLVMTRQLLVLCFI